MTEETWRDGSVTQRHLHLLNSEFMADCTFVVGMKEKKTFQCHKFLLSESSPVFYAMFNGELKEKGEVKVEDIEPQHFRKMLEFIYSNETELENAESALSVCYAANKYMINTLILKCIVFIKENLNEDIACRAQEFARLINNAELEAESLQYLQINISDVLKSASFPNAERATLINILNQDELCISSEVELFSACIRWAKSQAGSEGKLREVLGSEILSLIKFLSMTTEEFATTVVPSKLLEVQEACDILCSIATKTGNMPPGFNTNTSSRTSLAGPRETIVFHVHTPYGYHHYDSTFLNGQELNNNYPFNFSVNVKSLLYGIQFRGLYNGNPIKGSFGVNLLLASELLACAKFEGSMSAGEPVDVSFNKPILLKANANYTLQMRYSNLNASYCITEFHQSVYTTTAGVKMTVDFTYTSISQIYIAKTIK